MITELYFQMMKLVMPHMEKRRKGVIINISSLLAIYPMPLLTTYAACKVSLLIIFNLKKKKIEFTFAAAGELNHNYNKVE